MREWVREGGRERVSEGVGEGGRKGEREGGGREREFQLSSLSYSVVVAYFVMPQYFVVVLIQDVSIDEPIIFWLSL